MASVFKNAVTAGIGTTTTNVYTVPASTTATVIGLTVSNTTASNVTTDVEITDTSSGTTVFIVKAASVPVGGALVPIGGEQKIVLETSDIVKVTSSAAASLDVTVSILEQN